MHIAGISPLESWEWTWGEGCEAVNAYNRRENDRAQRRAVALYNAAAFLTHSIRTMITGGEMQKFAEAFPGFEAVQKQSREMTDEQMYSMARALNAMFGGKEDD